MIEIAGRCWWTWPGSNRRPPACKAGALPAELHAHSSTNHSRTFSIFLHLLPHGAVQNLSQFTLAPTPHFFFVFCDLRVPFESKRSKKVQQFYTQVVAQHERKRSVR